MRSTTPKAEVEQGRRTLRRCRVARSRRFAATGYHVDVPGTPLDNGALLRPYVDGFLGTKVLSRRISTWCAVTRPPSKSPPLGGASAFGPRSLRVLNKSTAPTATTKYLYESGISIFTVNKLEQWDTVNEQRYEIWNNRREATTWPSSRPFNARSREASGDVPGRGFERFETEAFCLAGVCGQPYNDGLRRTISSAAKCVLLQHRTRNNTSRRFS